MLTYQEISLHANELVGGFLLQAVGKRTGLTRAFQSWKLLRLNEATASNLLLYRPLSFVRVQVVPSRRTTRTGRSPIA